MTKFCGNYKSLLQLPNFGNRARDVEKFLKKSLARLDLQYVDLYLIHMPFALQLNDEGEGPLLAEDGAGLIDFNNDNVATWKVNLKYSICLSFTFLLPD